MLLYIITELITSLSIIIHLTTYSYIMILVYFFSTEASVKHTFKRYVGTMCNINVGIYTHVYYMCIYTYCIVEKFGWGEVWRIDSFRTFGKIKFDELIDQPIDY